MSEGSTLLRMCRCWQSCADSNTASSEVKLHELLPASGFFTQNLASGISGYFDAETLYTRSAISADVVPQKTQRHAERNRKQRNITMISGSMIEITVSGTTSESNS